MINDLYTGVVAGQAYDQNSTGVPGTPENNDAFGQVLDSVRAGSTTHLAVGIPSEDIGTRGRCRQRAALHLHRHHHDAGRWADSGHHECHGTRPRRVISSGAASCLHRRD